MEFADLLNTDPNTLPYFVTEARTGNKVPVHFEPLAPDDLAELQSSEWAHSVFAAVWQHYIGDGRTYKLVCAENEDRRIQGIVRLGSIVPYGRILKTSLLETAPYNRRDAPIQLYRGVGRVLVARLAVESVLQGGQGRIVVRPREGTASFYLAVGFIRRSNYILSETNAEALIRLVLLENSEGD